MKYIWVNPVVMKMYDEQGININEYLENMGFTVLQGNTEILNRVKKQFVEETKQAKQTVLDSRCPLAISEIQKHALDKGFYIPQIYPILIQVALDLYHTYVNGTDDNTLFIMCPCRELKKLGNDISVEADLKGLTFYAWNEWVKEQPIPIAEKTGDTPIPLGFFDSEGINVKKLTGEEEILEYIKQGPHNKDIDLIEMLYCKGGCHNGNGV